MNAIHRWAGKRRQVVARVEAALADPDPRTRRAAIVVAGERGLRSFAGALAERSRVERDEGVRRTLVEVVLRNQWEPSDNHDVAELRLWAHAAVRRPPDPAVAPVPPLAGLVARPASGNPGALETMSRGSQGMSTSAYVATLGGPTGAGSRRPAARPLPQPGRRPATTIVTGAGGPAGVAVIRALVGAGHRVVGADADDLAVGARLAHGAAIIPRADHPRFVGALCRLAASAGATVVIPTVAEELVALAEGRAEMAAAGLASWVPHPEAVRACVDKWRFAQIMVGAAMPVPVTNLASIEGVPGPWVIKPRSGRGSRDVHVAMTETEAAWALDRVPGALVQTRLEGREFTVDALVDRDGSLAGAVPRWRLETKAGISTKGRTFVDVRLVGLVAHVLGAVGLRGPANVQGFMTPDGTPSFIEVNPRFSGGLPLSLAAGSDLVGEYLRGILGQAIRPEKLLFWPGVTMLRHYEEVFE